MFTFLPEQSTAGIVECEDADGVDDCTRIDIDFSVLKDELDIAHDGVVFKHSYTLDNGDNTVTYSYESDDFGSAVLLYTELSGHQEVVGDILFEGQMFRIDSCGPDCHVLVQFATATMNPQPDDEYLAPVIDEHEVVPPPSLRIKEFVSRAKFLSKHGY